ncbi:DsrE family protein [Timonella senegalensis]|uniref:DsrE family protein n=1 Tax=Timonella senegalensis TaxID=1465825 RepID=UPI00031B1557|nr:DsrE family protein [Timonella senegalensis]
MTYSRLVIKSTNGTDRIETVNQALTVATTALAAGVETSVWLTGDSVLLAVPRYAADIELEHGNSFEDMVSLIIAEGSLTVCTQCAARRNLTQVDLLPGVRIAGSTSFVEEILRDGTQAIVY